MAGLTRRQVLDAALRQDLGTFVARVFQTINPGTPYRHNWHIDAIVHQLLAVRDGRTRRLMITQPPRSLKSICSSVAFVAWCLGRDPSLKFACVSYSQDLAGELSRQFRMVIESDWYRDLFPNVRWKRQTATECVTANGGGRYTVSVGGSFTGRGADIIIIDDPLKADEAHSEAARARVNDWYGGTLLSRLNDKRTGAIILVMQRLHEDDLAGHLLADEEELGETVWHRLDLPAIALEDQVIDLGKGRLHHRKAGDVLHSEREPLDKLEELKAAMGSRAFSAQYQQRPVPVDGNLIRRGWIGWYDTLPPTHRGMRIVQSWDLASSIGASNDWSVCTTWLMDRNDYYLVGVWRGKLEFPELKRKILELARRHGANVILIEKAGPGLQMVQELRRHEERGIPRPIGIVPDGDKWQRMEAQSIRFEAGQVHFPREAPWLSDLLQELFGFPETRHDDQVDSISQFLGWAGTRAARRRSVPHPPILVTIDDISDRCPNPFAEPVEPVICGAEPYDDDDPLDGYY